VPSERGLETVHLRPRSFFGGRTGAFPDDVLAAHNAQGLVIHRDPKPCIFTDTVLPALRLKDFALAPGELLRRMHDDHAGPVRHITADRNSGWRRKGESRVPAEFHVDRALRDGDMKLDSVQCGGDTRLEGDAPPSGFSRTQSDHAFGNQIDRTAAPWMAPARIPLLLGSPGFHAGGCAVAEHFVPGVFVFRRDEVVGQLRLAGAVTRLDNERGYVHAATQAFLADQVHDSWNGVLGDKSERKGQRICMQRTMFGPRGVHKQTGICVKKAPDESRAHHFRFALIRFRVPAKVAAQSGSRLQRSIVKRVQNRILPVFRVVIVVPVA